MLQKHPLYTQKGRSIRRAIFFLPVVMQNVYRGNYVLFKLDPENNQFMKFRSYRQPFFFPICSPTPTPLHTTTDGPKRLDGELLFFPPHLVHAIDVKRCLECWGPDLQPATQHIGKKTPRLFV